jgi:hypothetical protein
MTFLHALGNTTAHSTSSAAVQVTIIVVAAFIVGIVGWVARRLLKRQTDRENALKEKDEQRTKDMNEVKIAIGEVRGALITDAPTPYNPFPQKKLVDRFNELWNSHFELKRLVEQIDTRSVATKADTAALVQDSETNKGHTSRDSADRTEAGIGRIEVEQANVRRELNEKNNPTG